MKKKPKRPGRPRGPKKESIGILLRPELARKLRARAAEEGWSLSETVARALARFLID